jgi:RNA-directed DNA polymerase
MALFSDSKRQLWHWRQAVIERLATLRLTVHPQAQVTPVRHGIPWLGFLVYPDHRRVKARNVHNFRRRLRERWQEYCAGAIRFAEFDASVQGWINHVRYADTWGLRQHVLDAPLRRP